MMKASVGAGPAVVTVTVKVTACPPRMLPALAASRVGAAGCTLGGAGALALSSSPVAFFVASKWTPLAPPTAHELFWKFVLAKAPAAWVALMGLMTVPAVGA